VECYGFENEQHLLEPLRAGLCALPLKVGFPVHADCDLLKELYPAFRRAKLISSLSAAIFRILPGILPRFVTNSMEGSSKKLPSDYSALHRHYSNLKCSKERKRNIKPAKSRITISNPTLNKG